LSILRQLSIPIREQLERKGKPMEAAGIEPAGQLSKAMVNQELRVRQGGSEEVPAPMGIALIDPC